jgi:hypothetical protein
MEEAQLFFFGEVGVETDLGQVLLKGRDRHHGGGIGGVSIFLGYTVRGLRRRTDLGDLFIGRTEDLRLDGFFVEILLAGTHSGRDYHKILQSGC